VTKMDIKYFHPTVRNIDFMQKLVAQEVIDGIILHRSDDEIATTIRSYICVEVNNELAGFVALHIHSKNLGFGYAKVSKSLKKDWDIKLTNFLEKRASLRIFIHLIDARHINLDIDNSVDDFLHHLKRGDQIIVNAFTKIDKLKQNDLSKLKRNNPNGIFISNLKKRGMQDLERVISDFIFKGIVRD